MNIELEALEGIEVYNASNFKESDLLSPLCFIIDGVVEIEPFNILLKYLQGFKPISIQISEFVYFLSLEIGINDFKSHFFKKFQSMNYSLRSFFLKKSISESIINHLPFVKEHVYYLFYEEKENNILNTEIFPSTIKNQTISKHPRKTLYEFSNFSELSSNYTKIIQTQLFLKHTAKKSKIV